MTHNQEKRLLNQCLNQDRLAQRMLYEQYKTAMYSCALRITKDPALAQDVLQEAFVKIFNSLGNFRGKGTLGSWIKTIVIRVALKMVKGLHLQVEVQEKHFEDVVRFDECLTGELLHELILSLPDRSRVVFNLIEVEGYSHKEVAELIGVSIGTSKSQLNYAKNMLKNKLQIRGYESRKRG